MEWIKVSDKLPTVGEVVLLYNDAMLSYVVGYYDGCMFHYAQSCFYSASTSRFNSAILKDQRKNPSIIIEVYPNRITEWSKIKKHIS